MKSAKRGISKDPGAFGVLSPKQKNILEGASRHLRVRLRREQRARDDWSLSFVSQIHRELFYRVFPEQAGIQRQVNVILRDFVVPRPEQIPYRLVDLIGSAHEIFDSGKAALSDEDRLLILPKIAAFHADCIVVQPFIDGNKRWARAVMDALLNDCGFYPGTDISDEEREHYLEGVEKAAVGKPEQLANLILKGWISQRRIYASGQF